MENNNQSEKYLKITEDDLPKTAAELAEFDKRVDIYGTFKMNRVEYLRYKKFLDDHSTCRIDPETHFSKFGTIGGGTVVSFMNTGLGPIIHVKCEACGAEANITDVDSW